MNNLKEDGNVCVFMGGTINSIKLKNFEITQIKYAKPNLEQISPKLQLVFNMYINLVYQY